MLQTLQRGAERPRLLQPRQRSVRLAAWGPSLCWVGSWVSTIDGQSLLVVQMLLSRRSFSLSLYLSLLYVLLLRRRRRRRKENRVQSSGRTDHTNVLFRGREHEGLCIRGREEQVFRVIRRRQKEIKMEVLLWPQQRKSFMSESCTKLSTQREGETFMSTEKPPGHSAEAMASRTATSPANAIRAWPVKNLSSGFFSMRIPFTSLVSSTVRAGG